MNDCETFRFDEYISLISTKASDSNCTVDVSDGRAGGDEVPGDKIFQPLPKELFLQEDDRGCFGLETLFLKIGLFYELCQLSARIHESSSQNRPDICPANILVDLKQTNCLIPKAWSFQLRFASNNDSLHGDENGLIQYGLLYLPPRGLNGSSGCKDFLAFEQDSYCLGMMLFRELLVADEQESIAILGECRKAGERLDRFAGTLSVDEAPAVAVAEINKEIQKSIFSGANRFSSKGNNEYEERISLHWKDSLTLGFRLITNIPGFSFVKLSDDWSSAMTLVLKGVDELIGRLRNAAFPAPLPCNRDLHSILSGLIADQAWLDEAFGGVSPVAVSTGPAESRVSQRAPSLDEIVPAPRDLTSENHKCSKNADPDFESTIIARLPTSTLKKSAVVDVSANEPKTNDMESAAIIRPGVLPPGPAGSLRGENGARGEREKAFPPDFDSTIIIRPGTVQTSNGEPFAPVGGTVGDSEPEDEGEGNDMDSTIILRPKNRT